MECISIENRFFFVQILHFFIKKEIKKVTIRFIFYHLSGDQITMKHKTDSLSTTFSKHIERNEENIKLDDSISHGFDSIRRSDGCSLC